MSKPGPIGTGQIAGSIQRLPKIEHFAHLLHFESGAGGAANGLPITDFGINPGFLTRTGVTATAALQAQLDDVIAKNARFARLKIGLVDLTRDVNAPEFAGHRALEQGTLGSTGKLSIMYAAFQLRFDLEVHAFLQNLKTADDVFEAARESWSLSQIETPGVLRTELHAATPLLERAGSLILRDGRKMPLIVKDKNGGLRNQGGPLLEEIFDVTAASIGATVAFKPAFFAHMNQMIPHSNNDSAHFCATRIGFLFIDSALWQMDLYNPNRGSGGGQWVGGSYGGTVWGPPPVGGNFKQGGTAASVAALVTLIGQDRLVNKAACIQMRDELMDQFAGFGGYGSWLTSGLAKTRRILVGDRAFAKLGITDGLLFDAVLVQSFARGKNLRYVMVALGAPQTTAGEQLLRDVAVELHDCIDRNNPQASR